MEHRQRKQPYGRRTIYKKGEKRQQKGKEDSEVLDVAQQMKLKAYVRTLIL